MKFRKKISSVRKSLSRLISKCHCDNLSGEFASQESTDKSASVSEGISYSTHQPSCDELVMPEELVYALDEPEAETDLSHGLDPICQREQEAGFLSSASESVIGLNQSPAEFLTVAHDSVQSFSKVQANSNFDDSTPQQPEEGVWIERSSQGTTEDLLLDAEDVNLIQEILANQLVKPEEEQSTWHEINSPDSGIGQPSQDSLVNSDDYFEEAPVSNGFDTPAQHASDPLLLELLDDVEIDDFDDETDLSRVLVSEDGDEISQRSRPEKATLLLQHNYGRSDQTCELLANYSVTSGWNSAMRAIEFHGITDDELRTAIHLRSFWGDNSEFWRSNSRYEFQELSWDLALRLVRWFSAHPSIDELECLMLDSLGCWAGSHVLQDEYRSFRDFLSVMCDSHYASRMVTPSLSFEDSGFYLQCEDEFSCGSNKGRQMLQQPLYSDWFNDIAL